MLQSLTIKDFQSHKSTTLEFHKGVNVIVGKSDAGKSSILRALGWAITNKCDDASFLRKGAKSVSVQLEFDDCIITRERNTTGNIYKLFAGKSEEPFKAFKQEIPADIVEALNMTEINISTQLEPPFLLSQTSGEVAKTLNRMVDLSVIHESLTGIKKLVTQNSRDIENTLQQIEENKKEVGTFKFLRSLEHKVKAYEALCKEKIEVDVSIQDLTKAILKVQEFKVDVEAYSDLLGVEEIVDETLESVESVRKSTKQIKIISSLIENITNSQEEYKKLQALIEIEPIVKEAVELIKSIADITKLMKATEHVVNKIAICEEEIANMETEYIEIMPEECPLCGHEMLEEV